VKVDELINMKNVEVKENTALSITVHSSTYQLRKPVTLNNALDCRANGLTD